MKLISPHSLSNIISRLASENFSGNFVVLKAEDVGSATNMTFQRESVKSLSGPVVTLNCDITLRCDRLMTPAGTVLFRT